MPFKKGYISSRKNKTHEEYFGKEKALEIDKKISKSKMGHIVKEETRKKMSLKKIGKPSPRKGVILTEETLQKMRIAQTGKKATQETKIKMSLASKGKPKSEEHRLNTSKGKKGIRLTEKHRKNISNSKIGRFIGDDNPNYGKHHSEETKKKMKIARAKVVFPIQDTKPEIKTQSFLKEMNLPFIKHKYMDEIEHAYQCDIFIPSFNLIIECDGNYWHKYPVGRDIDRIRTKELQEAGYVVWRLWESEIKTMTLEQFRNMLPYEFNMEEVNKGLENLRQTRAIQ